MKGGWIWHGFNLLVFFIDAELLLYCVDIKIDLFRYMEYLASIHTRYSSRCVFLMRIHFAVKDNKSIDNMRTDVDN